MSDKLLKAAYKEAAEAGKAIVIHKLGHAPLAGDALEKRYQSAWQTVHELTRDPIEAAADEIGITVEQLKAARAVEL